MNKSVHIIVETVISEHIIVIKLKIEQNAIIIKIVFIILSIISEFEFPKLFHPPYLVPKIAIINATYTNSQTKDTTILIIKFEK